MKTILSTSTSASRASVPLALIRGHFQRVRLAGLLWALLCMLIAFSLWQAEVLGWWGHGSFCALCFAVASLGLLVLWLFCGSRLNLTQTTRSLDTQWSLKARLESALELEKQDSALAASLREEVGGKLEHRRPPLLWLWSALLSLLVLACVLSLTELVMISLPKKALAPVAPSAKALAASPVSPAPAEAGPKTAEADKKQTQAQAAQTKDSAEANAKALEKLVEQQEQVQKLLASASGQGVEGKSGAGAAGEAGLAQSAAALAGKPALGSKARAALQRAAGEAGRAEGRLRAGDLLGARVPVMAASLALQEAKTELAKPDSLNPAKLALRSSAEGRTERVHRFNADAVDPKYKAATEDYFERLSREGEQP